MNYLAKHILTLGLLLCGLFAAQAQSFEGIVEVSQQTADGITYQMKWYVKGDRVAYEIISADRADALGPLRFVPLPEYDKMLMISGGNRTEVASRDINSAGMDLSGVNVREENGKLVVTTANSTTEIEVNKTVDVDWSRLARFFKSDYGIYALSKSGIRGFPVNSVTKDRNGKILSQTTLKRVQAMRLDDSYFK